MSFSLFGKKSLGIDIGAASIKMVEVSKRGRQVKLENYLEFKLPHGQKEARTFNEDTLLLSSRLAGRIVSGLLIKEGIKPKKAAVSLPDFSTFFTVFSLPPMHPSEIASAVEFEARHHIPLPLSEVVFDWQVVSRGKDGTLKKIKVLLVAVPKNVLERYQKMAEFAFLGIAGLEAEVFSLIRAVVSGKFSKETVCLLDFGWQSTTASFVADGKLLASYSFDVSATRLTEDLSRGLGINFGQAEQLKKEHGLNPKQKKVYVLLEKDIAGLTSEVKKALVNFEEKQEKEVSGIILAGGTALMFGLREYLEAGLEKSVYLAEPFSSVSFDKILEPRLKQIGPSFAVALGTALMGLGV